MDGTELERADSTSRRLMGDDLSSAGPFLGRFDVRSTWQVVAGAVLLGAGVTAILLGYTGVARATMVEEQIPYVVSGGVFGLGLIVMGGFLFWAHWLYRQYERAERHQRRSFEQAERHHTELLAALAGAGILPSAPGGRPIDEEAGLVVTDRGSAVHVPSCPTLVGKSNLRRLNAIDAAGLGLGPCRMCEPTLETPGREDALPGSRRSTKTKVETR